jgi:hypothetical protein
MDIKQLNEMISGKPFFFSAMHDYTLEEDHISGLGLYEEDMIHLRTLIPVEWAFIETRRNPDNDFLRIDIIKRG